MTRPVARGPRKIFHDRPADQESRRFSFSFSWPLLAILGLILLGSIAWSFFMGYMVGAGQNPASRIEELTGLQLSSPATEQPASTPAGAPTEVEPEKASTPVTIEKAVSTPPSPRPEMQFRKPGDEALAAWGEKPPPKGQTPDKPKKNQAAQKDNTPQNLYNYTFQVAAFRNLGDAENLKKRLEAQALRCQIKKSGQVQLVLVNLRGSEAAPGELRATLKKLKLGAPLQLSKKPVTVKAKRGK